MGKNKQKEIPDQIGNDKLDPFAESGSGEIVLYQPEGENRLEVRVENDTVWLTQAQMAKLFHSTRNNVTLHIKNIFQEGELSPNSVSKDSLLTAKDGKKYKTKFYNLDVIISVGYRVKSIAGTRFRQWANKVLKDYMLKDYAANQRMVATGMQIANQFQEQQRLIENQSTEIKDVRRSVAEHDSRLSTVEKHIDFFVKATQNPTGGILATGARFDGLVLIADLVKLAKSSVVFIDPFATIEILKFAAMRAKGVNAVIYSAHITPEFKAAKEMHNKQYPGLELKTMRTIHDRFLLVDNTVYHFGASFKDMGNEMSAFSILNFVTPEEVIAKIQECMKGK